MKRSPAFTILEILAAVAVLAVLVALAFPVVNSAIGRSRSAACIANLRALGGALQTYLAEHNMTMPDLRAGRVEKAEEIPVIDNTLDKYVDDPRVFACPADPVIAKKSGTSYFWNSALSGQSAASLNFLLVVTDRSRIPVLLDKENWHPGGRVNHLFADGSAANSFRLFSDEQQ